MELMESVGGSVSSTSFSVEMLVVFVAKNDIDRQEDQPDQSLLCLTLSLPLRVRVT